MLSGPRRPSYTRRNSDLWRHFRLRDQFGDVQREFFLKQVFQAFPMLRDILVAQEYLQVAPPRLEGVAVEQFLLPLIINVLVENEPPYQQPSVPASVNLIEFLEPFGAACEQFGQGPV